MCDFNVISCPGAKLGNFFQDKINDRDISRDFEKPLVSILIKESFFL